MKSMGMGHHPAPTAGDVAFLSHLTRHENREPGEIRQALLEDDTYLDRLVEDPEVRDFLRDTDPKPESDLLLQVSAWLLFALYLRLARRELDTGTAVPEWTGAQEVVPVFDADLIRDALSSPEILSQLERLLTRYTRVRAGWYTAWERGHLSRRRWNDLDPASLLNLLPYAEGEVAADLLRRAGDAHLFLAGMFPEHVLGHLSRDLDAWERRGQGFYRAAAAKYEDGMPDWSGDLERLGGQFHGARRSLNYVMQRFWSRSRTSWFRPTSRNTGRKGVA